MHELYDDPEVRAAVVDRWGADMAPGGRVDRSAVAAKAFATADERSFLEGLLWPRVGERMMAWREEIAAAEPPPRAAVVEVPLLFESGMEQVFDHTVAVVAEEEAREQRAAARGHTAVASRSGRQLSQEEKSQRADHAVRNDGSLDDLRQQLGAVLAEIAK